MKQLISSFVEKKHFNIYWGLTQFVFFQYQESNYFLIICCIDLNEKKKQWFKCKDKAFIIHRHWCFVVWQNIKSYKDCSCVIKVNNKITEQIIRYDVAYELQTKCYFSTIKTTHWKNIKYKADKNR